MNKEEKSVTQNLQTISCHPETCIIIRKAFNLRKFCVLCKREGNKKSKYLKDIETKNSACVAKITKVKRTTSTISKKNNKDNIDRNKRNRNRKKKSDNTFSGILELFESDKESILLYHLSMLESKSR